MADNSSVNAIAKQAWDMAQRVAMQIAAFPAEQSLTRSELCGRLGARGGVAGEQMDQFIELQMKAIRRMVSSIDVSQAESLTG